MITPECISKTISYVNTHITYIHVISGFRHKVDENFALLGYYADSGGNLINFQTHCVQPEGHSSHHLHILQVSLWYTKIC